MAGDMAGDMAADMAADTEGKSFFVQVMSYERGS